MNQGAEHNKQAQAEQGGRRGKTGHEGGAAKEGHLPPQIDVKDGKAEGGGQIAQDSQQSSGQGSGQS